MKHNLLVSEIVQNCDATEGGRPEVRRMCRNNVGSRCSNADTTHKADGDNTAASLEINGTHLRLVTSYMAHEEDDPPNDLVRKIASDSESTEKYQIPIPRCQRPSHPMGDDGHECKG
ncbi:GL15384 [Drosophila persimilis]|uniref:GL15384 n=1 Tax=Drosophila persimilis TaxID=7234 RepID=B4HBC2_DROPE|nr:GL15384 [Drosophila persimilis]